MPGQVIFFAVMHGSRAMSVRRQFVKLRGPLMGILWHDLAFQNMGLAGLSTQTSRLVTTRIHRSLGQRHPREFFGGDSYAAL